MAEEGVEESFEVPSQDVSVVHDVAGADKEIQDMVVDSKSKDLEQVEPSAEDGKEVNHSSDDADDEEDSSEFATSNDSKLQQWRIEALRCRSGGIEAFVKEK
eukprot:13344069-Ditylum_brightwellii.AAC.1